MKIWKLLSLAASCGLILLVPACRTEPTSALVVKTAPAELLQPTYLYEVTRHLYRWYLDEAEVGRLTQAKQFVFWVRRLETKMDPGDQSVVGEIVLPQLGMSVKVKKADYSIEELQTPVKSQSFKIT